MNKLSKILLPLVFFVLAGCEGMKNPQIKQVVNNRQALLFYSTKLAPNISAVVLETNTEEEIHLKPSHYEFINFPHYGLLEPGEYSLSGFVFKEDDYSYVKFSTFHLNTNIHFDVKGGQVLYLGDIISNYYKGRVKNFNIVDNFDETSEQVSQKYPELVGRFQKLLMKRSMR